MTYTEIVETIAKETGKNKKDVSEILTSFTFAVRDAIRDGRDVRVPGFGRFSKRVVKPRKVFGKMSRGKTSVKFSPYSACEQPGAGA